VLNDTGNARLYVRAMDCQPNWHETRALRRVICATQEDFMDAKVKSSQIRGATG